MTAGRKKNQSRDELCRTLLEAGREILLEEGLGTGPGNLTFKKVFERVERDTGVRLTNASVIKRVWENQAAFQADVLVDIAHDEGRPEADETVRALMAVLERVDLSTVESRRRAVREVCRVGGVASSDALANSTNWSLWISVLAMATDVSSPEQRGQIQSALQEGYGAVAKFWEETLEGLISFLGLRLRQPWTMHQFVSAMTAYAQGCSIRQGVDGYAEIIVRPTGPNGEDQEWTLLAAGLEALMFQFFDPDPEFDTAYSPIGRPHARPDGVDGAIGPPRGGGLAGDTAGEDRSGQHLQGQVEVGIDL